MGQMLSSPVTCQTVERAGSLYFCSGVASLQGWRVNHEDAHTCLVNTGRNGAVGNFAVFDGHGGDKASKYAALNLFKEQEGFDENTSPDQIVASFLGLDRKLRDHLGKDGSGATCVNTIVACDGNGKYKIKVGNIGDSRAVLARRSGQVLATVDHKPNDEEETRRITAAGGFVSSQEPARLDGVLSLSRAFGDFQFKSDPHLEPKDQKMSVCPDVYEWEGETGDCLILACDGVFDVMTNEELAEMVSTRALECNDPAQICSEVLIHCLEKNSRDNMTCMVVIFGNGEHANRDMELLPGAFAQEQDEKVISNYVAFAREYGFDIKDKDRYCAVCHRLFLHMSSCPCKAVVYCSRDCQRADWKEHKKTCSAHSAKRSTSQGSKK